MMANPNIIKAIQNHIQTELNECVKCTIKSLYSSYNGSGHVSRAELINTIENAINSNHLVIEERNIPWENSVVSLCKSFKYSDDLNHVSIVISKPKLRELSLEDIKKRNNQLDTKDCFVDLINSASDTLRICSPFLQENVLLSNSMPELKNLILDALKRNVEIRILTRELFQNRGAELQWILDIASSIGKSDLVSIKDYHILDDNGLILSSTHAKLIIADYSSAYVGSAELRKNSLAANLEIGCLLKGPQIFGLCEIFDFMFNKGREWG